MMRKISGIEELADYLHVTGVKTMISVSSISGKKSICLLLAVFLSVVFPVCSNNHYSLATAIITKQ